MLFWWDSFIISNINRHQNYVKMSQISFLWLTTVFSVHTILNQMKQMSQNSWKNDHLLWNKSNQLFDHVLNISVNHQHQEFDISESAYKWVTQRSYSIRSEECQTYLKVPISRLFSEKQMCNLTRIMVDP